jgi:hypothetical protein
MFLNNLNKFFLFITILGTILFIYLLIDNYKFNNSKLNDEILHKIKQKQFYLENLTYKKFGISKKFPIIISDKLPSRLFGAAVFTNDQKIIIYLNKKRFKESVEYMIEDVLPHEYAHALMFYTNNFTEENAGHSKKWQNICKALDGLRCDRFVNHNDVIIGKTNFFD